jgi:hypothetical protein
VEAVQEKRQEVLGILLIRVFESSLQFANNGLQHQLAAPEDRTRSDTGDMCVY